MNRKEFIGSLIIVIFLLGLFFNQVFFKAKVPFPGDLLVSEYQPWKSESYLGYNPGSIPNKAQYPDTIRQLYPWRTLATNIFKSGQIPLWNPYNFSGSPLLANFQSAVFYPLSWLSLIMPQIWSWTVMIIFQPLAALIFTYLYCRKLKLFFVPSWFAALTYAFCAFSAVWLEYNTIGQVVVWLPMLLLAVEHFPEKNKQHWFIFFALGIAFSLLAGHPQVSGYLLLFSLIYAWFRLNNWRLFSRVIIFSLIGVGLSAIQLIPGMELISQAARSPHPVDIYLQKILIQPWQLIMTLVPDLFGNPATRNYWPLDTYVGKVTTVGIVGLILALISLKFFRKDNLIRFFSIASLAILILITANPLTALLYRVPLPFFSSSSPTLMTFLLAFSLSVLSAFGFEALLKNKVDVKKIICWLGFFTLIFVALWLSMYLVPKFIHADWAGKLVNGKRVLLQQTFIFVAAGALLLLSFKNKFKPVFYLLIFIQIFELFLGFRKFNPFVPKELVFPQSQVFNFLTNQNSVYRFWSVGSAAIDANFASGYSLFSPNGYDPLYPKRYGEFIQSTLNGKIHTDFTDQTRSDANIAPGSGDRELNGNLYRLKVLDLLGVKYVLDRSENGMSEKGLAPARFKEIWKQNDWIIYDNLKAAPRFFLTSDYRVFTNNSDFEKKFFDSKFDPSKAVLLEKELPEKLESSPRDKVDLIKYSPDEVLFKTQSLGSSLLFLSDVFYPGWQAWVDDSPVEILRADYAFRAVVVTPGNHLVRFIFKPKSFTIGLVISLISLFVLIILSVIKKLRNYA